MLTLAGARLAADLLIAPVGTEHVIRLHSVDKFEHLGQLSLSSFGRRMLTPLTRVHYGDMAEVW